MNTCPCGIKFKSRQHNHKYCSRRCAKYFTVKSWRERNPDETANYKRNDYLKRMYGINNEIYEQLFTKQNGKCAICMKSATIRLDVDHEHSTGEVRGLLCRQCNMAVGLFKDSPLIIKSALEYVS